MNTSVVSVSSEKTQYYRPSDIAEIIAVKGKGRWLQAVMRGDIKMDREVEAAFLSLIGHIRLYRQLGDYGRTFAGFRID